MGKSAYVIKKEINFRQKAVKKRPLLGRLDIELTERCNNNCLHCYINLPMQDMAARKKELPTSKIKEILQEAVSLGCVCVRFTGGEPLLRRDFAELYLFSRRLGLKVIIFTNATLITKRLAALLQKVPPLEEVEVTLYGMRQASYEEVSRKAGSYKKAIQGINLLRKNNIPFIVKGAWLGKSKNERKDFERWAKGIKAMQSRRPVYALQFDLRCRRDDHLKNRLINSLRPDASEILGVLTRDKAGYVREMKKFCAKFIAGATEKIFSCGAGAGGGCVDAYGFFQPCMMVRHPDCVYDLNKGTLKDALENFFPELRKLKARFGEYLARCAKCFLKGLCEQCPGKSWMEHGELDKPVEYLCESAHARARFLGLIGENEHAWEVKDAKKRIKTFIYRR